MHSRSSRVALLMTCCFSLPIVAAEPPFGLTQRDAWKGSGLAGTPEPPLPYTVERTYTNLTWKTPIYVAAEPGTDRVLVVLEGGQPEKPSRVLRLRDDPAVRESELFLELPRRLIYSVCFHPGYITNGYVFVFINGPTGASRRT